MLRAKNFSTCIRIDCNTYYSNTKAGICLKSSNILAISIKIEVSGERRQVDKSQISVLHQCEIYANLREGRVMTFSTFPGSRRRSSIFRKKSSSAENGVMWDTRTDARFSYWVTPRKIT